MFSKNILFFLNATLFFTTSVLAMDHNDMRFKLQKKLAMKKELQNQTEKNLQEQFHKQRFENILELYKDRIEYHRDMENSINEERLNLGDDKKFEQSLYIILGLPLRATNSEGDGLPLDEMIDDALKLHQKGAKAFEDFIKLRIESQDPILSRIALIYCRSIINQYDAEAEMERQKQRFRQKSDLGEIEEHYSIRANRDKIEFYNRVQKKVLEEFASFSTELYKSMIDFARAELQKDTNWILPQNFRLTEKEKAFYKSVIENKYKLPHNMNLSEIVIEEEKKNKSSIKKKRRKNRQRKTSVNRPAILQKEELKEGTVLDVIKTENDLNLLQIENDIKTEMPSLPKHTEENKDQEKISHQDGVDKESDWKDQLAKQIKVDREKKEILRQIQPNKKKEPLAVQTQAVKQAEIDETLHSFFVELLESPVTNPNIKWKSVVNLFNNDNGFRGKVYGVSGGVTHTFEIFLKFQGEKLVDFLTESEFNRLKTKAQPEPQAERNFLKHNKRLRSYRLSTGESIATSFFTLHNPHPGHCLYLSLFKRLREQLEFLGFNLETIQKKK